MKPAEIQAILEALLFVSDGTVTSKELAQVLPKEIQGQVDEQLEQLVASCDSDGRGLQIVQIAGGWKIQTRPELYPWVSSFLQVTRKERLSKAALETLAIVAYHQPLTGAEISEIRGVDTGSSIKTLLEKGLVQITGRKAVVGKPFLYGVTSTFLEEFGLNSLDDLPDLKEFEELMEEKLQEPQAALFSSEPDTNAGVEEAGTDEPTNIELESSNTEETDDGNAGKAEQDEQETRSSDTVLEHQAEGSEQSKEACSQEEQIQARGPERG